MKTRGNLERGGLLHDHTPGWKVLALALFGVVPLHPAGAACTQVVIPACHYSSWDAYGNQNRQVIEERRYPMSLVGKGPGLDYRANPGGLMVSRNVLGFQIPAITGAVASAELRLQLRFLVSIYGAETLQWAPVSNPRVRLQLIRLLEPVYDPPDASAVYGCGPVSVSDAFVSIPLTADFVANLDGAAGRTFLMEGSLLTLDDDPLNPQYLHLETGSTNALQLVLTLTGDGAPEIVRQPASSAIQAGGDASFHAVVCGGLPLSHQWQFNGVPVPEGTNAALRIPRAGPEHAGAYQVVVSNSFGAVTSAVATLEVLEIAPFFASEPSSQTVDAGQTRFSFHALASGAPGPHYQWQFNGTNLPGATNGTLSFECVTPASAGAYRVVASNTSGSVTSAPAILSVVPFYLFGPNDITVLLGNSSWLSISASGSTPPTACSWFQNGVEVGEPPDCTLTLFGAPEFAGDYVVIAWNQYGALTSRVAHVTVKAQAPWFTLYLRDDTVIAGMPYTLQVETSAGPPATYFWFRNGAGIPHQHQAELNLPVATLADEGQYSVVASNAWGQATNGPVTITVVPALVSVSPGNVNVGIGASVVFYAYYQGVTQAVFQWRCNGIDLPGQTNLVLVIPSVDLSRAGNYTFAAVNPYGRAESTSAGLVVSARPPSVSGLPIFLEKRAGDFLAFGGLVEGAPPPSVQWLFDGTPIPGATNYGFALSDLSVQHSGRYTVVASNAQGAVSSAPVVVAVEAPSPLDQWTWLNPRPQANPLSAVAAGDGRRVALGQHGTVLLSTNGLTWTARHLGRNLHLRSVTHGNGRFVAVGHASTDWSTLPVICSSPDGWNWTAHGVNARGKLNGVAFGAGRFVALGAQDNTSPEISVLLTSTDGLAWEQHHVSELMCLADLTAVCFGNDRFVAVSDGPTVYFDAALAKALFVSGDGLSWTPGQADLAQRYRAVAAGEGSFVAVGDDYAVAYSSDGMAWSAGTIAPSFNSLLSVAYGHGAYVAGGEAGIMFLSTAGSGWTSMPLQSPYDINGLTFSDGQFTAVANAGRILASSNLLTWTDQTAGSDLDLYGIAKGPKALVAVGDEGILASQDGTDWTQLAATRKIHGVTYGNGLFVAVGKRGTVLTSPDGFAWAAQTTPTTEYVERLVWAQNQFVAVGERATLLTSPDGTNWTQVPLNTPADLEHVAYGNGRFVVVGGYFDLNGAVATVLTSPDGRTWTDQRSVSLFGVRIRGVTFADGRFVLVGNDGLTGVSTNGIYWQWQFVGWENFRSATYAGGYFIAVGNEGLVASSRDGDDWTLHRCPAWMNLRDVTAVGDDVAVVGSNGTILRSGEIRPHLGARMLAGGLELDARGGLAPCYRLQISSDLRTWTEMGTYTNSAPARFLDPTAGTLPCRYYRLVPE